MSSENELRVGIDESLEQVEAPYINTPMPKNKKYTLVLDLDETLVHFKEVPEDEIHGGVLLVRPFAGEFLKAMSHFFELVIFTAGMQDYADWALEQVPNSHLISHRLYRQHASPQEGFYVKDLSRIGRDVSKTIIVDNLAENFQLQPENGIYICSWYDDSSDSSLVELAPLLAHIVTTKQESVSKALSDIRE